MDRRKFIKSIAKTAALVAVSSKVPFIAKAQSPKKNVDLVGVRNGEPVEMFRKGIEILGGMKRFCKSNYKVVIKPNISFDSPPERGNNTNPDLVGEIIRQVKAAGATNIVVFDHTLNEWRASYDNSGMRKAVESNGAKLLPANDEDLFVEQKNDKAKLLKSTAIYKELLDADLFINVPTLKNHGGAKMSCAIKNLMGIVWDRWSFHRTNLNQMAAELLLYKKPDLTVIDAYRTLIANGPRGVSIEDVKMSKYQIISTDIVAADTAALSVIGYKLNEVPYIKMAEELKMGTTDLKKLNISRIDASKNA